ncbi:DUF4232 domain-containing protein [Streptomyces sp. NPDC127092]|uniref:DUF4232 domain-containing protein n=1 Tax=Streptomyces sp. NPDC127092 TaxID=3347135 RepID=UPI00364DAF30
MRIVARRLALPAAALAAALALTACQSDDAPAASPKAPDASASASQGAPEASATEAVPPAEAAPTPTKANAPKPAAGTARPTTAAKPTTPAGSSTSTRAVTCTAANTRIVASRVSRPVNHLLLTVTNVGGRPCNALGAPIVGFDDPQAPIAVVEDSRPQAVVTLAPGESGYASVILTGEPGPDTHGRTVRKIRVGLTPESDTTVAAPSGTFADAGAAVSYWQRSLEDALTY